ncbi:MAG: esterase-like activity of phytase family protein [Bacteroidaceae bacterium]|nr:esterase-like activity of phytase family protein [Bacteroidaceae bacterium]
MRNVLLPLLLLLPSLLHSQPLPQRSMAWWGVKPAHYSGITPLGNDLYAIVGDKEPIDGFHVMRITQDPTTGKVTNITPEGYRSRFSPSESAQSPQRDWEGITYSPTSQTVFISGEADQRIVEYDLNGVPTGRELNVPAEFAIDKIYRNLGFEALAYSSATHHFWTITEGPLCADGTPNSPTQTTTPNYLRLQSFDDNLQPVAQYAYRMDLAKATKPGRSHAFGVPEVCALPDGKLLVLEREIRISPSYLSSHVECKIFKINPLESHQIDSTTDLKNLDPNQFMIKELVATFKTQLTPVQYNFANYEGMCLGIRLNDGTQTLLLINDSQAGQGNGLVTLKDYIKVIKL